MSMFRIASRRLALSASFPKRQFASSSFVAASRHGNDPEVLGREKARNLKGTQDSSTPFKEGAPGWNEHLASDSEAAVKADHHTKHEKPTKELQDATVAQTHAHHDKGGHKHGVEHHDAKHQKAQTGSEEAVKADRGDH
ncbi:hypothetical protein BD324DRAFT_614981 [Kockovaella imperatae]|uniref:Uncharacterized protein n=1 Tax=Kockovaella imperatae TaxID=4999 RepID=A0A1Y1UQR3_9TREE|nr:hypothetical protein BD324DRAFT_614981 [Kockovaella imperatae]ORX39786.1 hypothetical protein BD324DRAFT_614981 [Kockovaella imperatae]